MEIIMNAYLENEQLDHDIVGYIDGKAIVIDENGRWYFVEMPEEFISKCDVFFEEDLTPIDVLPFLEQKIILDVMEER